MALERCDRCDTLFAVGVDDCPQCGSKQHHEEGAAPPKKKSKK